MASGHCSGATRKGLVAEPPAHSQPCDFVSLGWWVWTLVACPLGCGAWGTWVCPTALTPAPCGAGSGSISRVSGGVRVCPLCLVACAGQFSVFAPSSP